MYNKVQLIAYHTPTLLGSPTKKPPSVVAIPPAIKALTNEDEKHRLMRMYQVVLWAATDPCVDKDPSTLKVFVGPEFYFKTPGQNSGGARRGAGGFGAYSFNTMINMVECLRQLFQSPVPGASADLLKHFLIIPGTIVSDLPGDGKTYSEDVAKNVYLNTAVVVKGEDKGFSHFVHKYFISGIDGPPENQSLSACDPYKTMLTQLAAAGKSEFDSYHFEVDNVSFAFDICLDHAQGVARATANKVADVHLVTACGMELLDKSLVARSGGHAMICDGHPGRSFPRSDVRSFNGATMGESLWNCDGKALPSLKAGDSVAGRKAIPEDLQVGAFDQVEKFEGGKSVGVVKNPGGTGWLFPEEVVWYKPVKR